MTTQEIKEFVDRGLITRKILIEATGLKSAISNRLKYKWRFHEMKLIL
jgi:hypothetical protein